MKHLRYPGIQNVFPTPGKIEYEVRRGMRLVERTTPPDGQFLLDPDYELEGWWTNPEDNALAVIWR